MGYLKFFGQILTQSLHLLIAMPQKSKIIEHRLEEDVIRLKSMNLGTREIAKKLEEKTGIYISHMSVANFLRYLKKTMNKAIANGEESGEKLEKNHIGTLNLDNMYMFLTDTMKDIEKHRYINFDLCMKDFRDLAKTIEDSIEAMIKLTPIINLAGKSYLQNPQFQANHILFARTIETVISAYNHSLKGEYGTVKALVRMVIENALLMRYFKDSPDNVKKWWDGKFEFRFGQIIDKLFTGKLKTDYRNIYKVLCNYIHPSFDGCREYLVPIKKDKEYGIILIRNIPLYHKPYAEDCLKTLNFSIYITMKSIIDTFPDYILKNQEMTNTLIELEPRIVRFLPVEDNYSSDNNKKTPSRQQ